MLKSIIKGYLPGAYRAQLNKRYDYESGRNVIVWNDEIDKINTLYLGIIAKNPTYSNYTNWKDAVTAKLNDTADIVNQYKTGAFGFFRNLVAGLKLKGLKTETAIVEASKEINSWSVWSLNGFDEWVETPELVESANNQDLAYLVWYNGMITKDVEKWNYGYNTMTQMCDFVFETKDLTMKDPTSYFQQKDYSRELKNQTKLSDDRKRDFTEATEHLLSIIDDLEEEDHNEVFEWIATFMARFVEENQSYTEEVNIITKEVWEVPMDIVRDSKAQLPYNPEQDAWACAKEIIELIHGDFFDLSEELCDKAVRSPIPAFQWLPKDQTLSCCLKKADITTFNEFYDFVSSHRMDDGDNEDLGEIADAFVTRIQRILASGWKHSDQPDEEKNPVRFIMARISTNNPKFIIYRNKVNFLGERSLKELELLGDDGDLEI